MRQNLDPEALSWVVNDLAYHQARVLLLVQAVAAEPSHARKLDGLTKLAKLDFLVRYPAMASLVLDDLEYNEQRMHISDAELHAPTEVEDPMIRYKYGPWDDRYYSVVGALVSKGLLNYVRGRRGSVALTVTPAGKEFSSSLLEEALWRDVADRCEAVAQASSGLSGNAIKELIYAKLTGLMDRPHREVIA